MKEKDEKKIEKAIDRAFREYLNPHGKKYPHEIQKEVESKQDDINSFCEEIIELKEQNKDIYDVVMKNPTKLVKIVMENDVSHFEDDIIKKGYEKELNWHKKKKKIKDFLIRIKKRLGKSLGFVGKLLEGRKNKDKGGLNK